MATENKIILTDKQAQSIAGDLDCGFKVLYNLKTGETVTIIDREEAFEMMEEDEKRWEILDENAADYFEFEKMYSNDSYKIMENFCATLKNAFVRNKLETAINKRKPFQNFHAVLNFNMDYLDDWYAFRNQAMINFTKNQVENFNTLNSSEFEE